MTSAEPDSKQRPTTNYYRPTSNSSQRCLSDVITSQRSHTYNSWSRHEASSLFVPEWSECYLALSCTWE